MESNFLLKFTYSNLKFVLLILAVNLKCIKLPYSIFYLQNYIYRNQHFIKFSKNVVLFRKCS